MVHQGLADSLKRLSRENNGKEYTDIEAREAAERLVGFFNLLLKVDQRIKLKVNEEIQKTRD